MRFCVAPNCPNPVFGTCKVTGNGYCKSHQSLREDFDHRSILQKAVAKHKENLKNNPNPRQEKFKQIKPKEKRITKRSVANSIRGLIDTPQNKENLSKSKLLKLADAAFARFVRTRDTHNGKILCPCCKKEFDADSVDKDGVKIANCMHFINRNIYSYRFREDFAAAGHSTCNQKQHYAPTGIEYQNFKQHLINLLGEQEVAEAEIAHRKINKLEVTILKNVIEHYNT